MATRTSGGQIIAPPDCEKNLALGWRGRSRAASRIAATVIELARS